MKHFIFLRLGNDPLDNATRHSTIQEAVDAYAEAARELDRYGQKLEATLHLAPGWGLADEYPDYVLSMGPRGGIRRERA